MLTYNDAQRISREYQDFAYIVSHDLNAPIRHIKQFTGLLLEARQDELSQEEQDYAHFLYGALDRIDGMQEALLEFSRLNTRPEMIEDVDCSAAVQKALELLDDEVIRIETQIDCAALPVLKGQPHKLERLFYLLLDNALKFHEEAAVSRHISVSASDQGDCWLFEVQDDGIGIPEVYHDEVLKMFRRLHPDSYEGMGAGLSLAQKIIQGHGGTLAFKSGTGTGTCVMFSLAK